MTRFLAAHRVLVGTLLSLGAVSAALANDRPPEQVFRAVCAYCHGYALAPSTLVAPELRGRQLPPVLVATLVRQGGSRMPAFRHTEVSDAELQALGRWIQASAAPAPAAHPGATR